ncbi:ATP-binding protein, partial [Brevibacillus borstelensis]|uniref:ATP-binding protein n=1 Tax=Brevibacillus borstelensis TaxID=45462 RepID=UPI002E1F86B0|nr:ATP-binding protein [Brevibacillus borstelensis]
MWFVKKDNYSLEEVYGIVEIPPEDCPTYVERKAHRDFNYAVKHEKQHIVVYGASRQGKTWLVEKYCPNFVRVGCDAKFTREELFKAILHELDVKVGNIQVGSKSGLSGEGKLEGKASINTVIAKKEVIAGAKLALAEEDSEQLTYANITLTNQTEVISAIKERIGDSFIVIENFHYLDPAVQKLFAISLREFLYAGIRVIVVGVWKDTTKLVSLASDLTNRIEPVDIGDWKVEELGEIVTEGDKALNTQTDQAIIDKFIFNSGRNVGIFKSLLKNFCKVNGIYETVYGRLK